MYKSWIFFIIITASIFNFGCDSCITSENEEETPDNSTGVVLDITSNIKDNIKDNQYEAVKIGDEWQTSESLETTKHKSDDANLAYHELIDQDNR